MNNPLYKINFFVRGEHEYKEWERFQTWLLEKCLITPLDFAVLPTVEKICFMAVFFINNGKGQLNIQPETKRRIADIMAQVLGADVKAVSREISLVTYGRRAKNESQFTFVGKGD